MKLQQLRYVLEVARHNLNISEVAEALFTSQPGVSKQIRLLEDELGVSIFIRNGKRIVAISEPGQAVLRFAEQIMRNVRNIREISDDFARMNSGDLTVATSHTQARYMLPDTIASFTKLFPDVRLIIKQGSPDEVSDLALQGNVDFSIVTECLQDSRELALLPCYQWNRSVIVPRDHPILRIDRPLRLADLAVYPLVTYEFAFTPCSKIYKAFSEEGLQPTVALSAVDSDVIKTYVRLGLGVGLIETMAYQALPDADLVCLDVGHLFEKSTAHIVIRRDSYLRGYAYQFIALFAPELTREKIEDVLYTPPEPYYVEDFII